MVEAMVSVGLFGALIAGVFSLLSPCSALLLPAFFAYAFTSKRQLIARTFVFFLGLCLVFVPLGMGIGWFGQGLARYRDHLIMGGGIAMIVFGIVSFFGGGFTVPGLARLNNRVRGTDWLAVLALGAVYGFSGFCAGPLLGAVLTTAFMASSVFYGGLIMAVYALGMAVPLLLLAWVWDARSLGNSRWLRGREVHLGALTLNSMSMAAGLLFILIGALFIKTRGMSGMPSLLSMESQHSVQLWVHNLVQDFELELLLGSLVIALIYAGQKLIRSLSR